MIISVGLTEPSMNMVRSTDDRIKVIKGHHLALLTG